MSDKPDVIYTGTEYLEFVDDAYAVPTYYLKRRYPDDVKYLLATPEREGAKQVTDAEHDALAFFPAIVDLLDALSQYDNPIIQTAIKTQLRTAGTDITTLQHLAKTVEEERDI